MNRSKLCFAIFLWITLLFLYYFVKSTSRGIKFDRQLPLEQSCDISNKHSFKIDKKSLFFEQPKCFTEWNQLKIYSTEHYLTQMFRNNELFTKIGAKVNIFKYQQVTQLNIICERWAKWNWEFQHFIYCLLPFVSFQLWYYDTQTRFVANQKQGESMSSLISSNNATLQYMMVPSGTFTDFFGHLRHHWIDDFAKAMYPVLGDFILPVDCQQVISNIIEGRNIYNGSNEGVLNAFFRPSDALQLSSYILHLDPCRYEGRAQELMSSPAPIVVLNRKSKRSIINIKEVMSTLLNSELLNKEYMMKSNEEIYFEGKSFIEQGLALQDVGILITPHGAQIANTFHLAPCSCIIEIFPFGMHFPGDRSYFDRLAEDIEVFKFEMSDSVHHNRDHKSSLLDKMERGEVLTSWDCIRDPACWTAIMNDVVNVNVVELMKLLQLAIKTRKDCIRYHPMYNSGAGISNLTSNFRVAKFEAELERIRQEKISLFGSNNSIVHEDYNLLPIKIKKHRGNPQQSNTYELLVEYNQNNKKTLEWEKFNTLKKSHYESLYDYLKKSHQYNLLKILDKSLH